MNQSLATWLEGDSRGTRGITLERLLEQDEVSSEDDLKRKHQDKINAAAGREVDLDSIHVRGMHLCNTRMDYYYSSFSRGAISEVVELLPGAPMMLMHDYFQGMPEGKFFHAQVARHDAPGVLPGEDIWADGLYFVPKDQRGDELIRRIDLGMNEVSIGWRCLDVTCSECKQDIRACRHIPGEIYDGGFAHYTFGGILSVLEASQVFRGGQKDTSNFTPEGFEPSDDDGETKSLFSDWKSLTRTKQRYGDIVRSMPAGKYTPEKFAKSVRDRGVEADVRTLWSMFGLPGKRSNVQSLTLAKSRFSDMSVAARYVRDHDFRADKRKVGDGGFSFQQFPERLADPETWQTQELQTGVTARLAERKSDKKEDRVANEGSLERLLSGVV